MNLTPEERDQVAAELKRFGADLQLTDDQKTKLQQFLTEARAKVAEYTKQSECYKGRHHQAGSRQSRSTSTTIGELSESRTIAEVGCRGCQSQEFLGQQMAA